MTLCRVLGTRQEMMNVIIVIAKSCFYYLNDAGWSQMTWPWVLMTRVEILSLFSKRQTIRLQKVGWVKIHAVLRIRIQFCTTVILSNVLTQITPVFFYKNTHFQGICFELTHVYVLGSGPGSAGFETLIISDLHWKINRPSDCVSWLMSKFVFWTIGLVYQAFRCCTVMTVPWTRPSVSRIPLLCWYDSSMN